MYPPLPRPGLIVLRLLAATALAPGAAAAQHRAEMEIEREDGVLTSRLEFYGTGLPWFRLEREGSGDQAMNRAGVQLPARLIGLAGYASFFVDDRPARTYRGAAFELGRGVPAVGGSIERGTRAYTGLYLKLRSANAELGLGGGQRDQDWLQHGALYLKGVRWAAAVGGARGPNQIDFQHLAASWHPAVRGSGPGARFSAERRNSRRWVTELMVADRAAFNHFSVWGNYGMDQWPHRKTFEAVDDMMRYVRPPVMDQAYTAGAGIVGGKWDVNGDEREFTLDGRFFPARLLGAEPMPAGVPPTDSRGYLRERVLPGLMIGGYREMSSGAGALLGEIVLPPFAIYGELPLADDAISYLFVQYRAALPF